MTGAGHLVEDHPGEVHLGVEVLATQHQGGGGAGGHGAVHHQHHRVRPEAWPTRRCCRCPGHPGRRKGRDCLRSAGHPLASAWRDYHAIIWSPSMRKGSRLWLGHARGQGMPGRVDVIGPLFEGHDSSPLVPPGGQEPQRQGGLTGPAPQSCQQQTGTGPGHQCFGGAFFGGISMKLPPK